MVHEAQSSLTTLEDSLKLPIPTVILASIFSGCSRGAVPWSVEWRLLPTDKGCTQIGRNIEELVRLGYAPGDSPGHLRLTYTRHGGRAIVTWTEWGIPSDSMSAWRVTYQVVHAPDGGMVVVDCSYENACHRQPLGIGGGPCP
jgi:hypothetical protein